MRFWWRGWGHGDDVLSLHAPGGKGFARALGCMLVAVVICLLQASNYLEERIASSTVAFLAILAGLTAFDGMPAILELRLERDEFVVRQAWAVHRYRWHEIPARFHIVAGSAGPRITFVWCPGSTVVREFLQPESLGMTASGLATLLNERWDRAWQRTESNLSKRAACDDEEHSPM